MGLSYIIKGVIIKEIARQTHLRAVYVYIKTDKTYTLQHPTLLQDFTFSHFIDSSELIYQHMRLLF